MPKNGAPNEATRSEAHMTASLLKSKWVASNLKSEATSTLSIALDRGTPIALYGAGQTGRLVAKSLQGAATLFIDDTPEKIDTFIEGIPVYSLANAFENFGQNLLVIVCIFSAKHQYSKTKLFLEEQFHWQTCTFTQALLFKPGNLPYFYIDDIAKQSSLQDEYIEILNKLADQRSKDALIENLQARLLANFSGGIDLRSELDFLEIPPDAMISYVDAGAYDGDTIQEFIEWRRGNFGNIIALEPDAANFHKLTARVSRFPPAYTTRIELRQAAIWSHKGHVSFLATQSVGSSISDKGNNLVATETLDSFINLPDPLIIKLDIEGAERESISGGLAFIKSKKPILAISVYHNPNDLVSIFKLIESLNLGYKFFLRCHGGDGTDLMLYCSPPTVNAGTGISANS